MDLLLTNRDKVRRIIHRRRRLGLDRKDEVWNGRYIIMPDPDNVHQEFVAELVFILTLVVKRAGLGNVYPGGNISDREEKWTSNYRVPDVTVFLNDNPAENRNTHWFGGPDLAIEIVSDNDKSRKKLDFYASVATRELLIVDRAPWQLELFRLIDGELVSVGKSSVADGNVLVSEVVPLSIRLIAGATRPQIEARHVDGVQSWTI
ncbi:MAG: Uma2 family endonuclease [Planctomycetales bacterium]|nr:Uma2 family endonuclease [Planctomycetales bacterium]